MNLRLNFILLLIAAVLGGWYFSQQTPEKDALADLIKKEGEPDYTGNKMQTSVFDVDGKPQYFAIADNIKRYENTDRTEFVKPLVNLFDKVTALKQWQVTAEKAEITTEKILNLSGKVKIESLDPTSRLQKLETEQLSVNLNTQDVSSDVLVKSKGLGFTTEGTGLKGNLKQQVATLLKDVKTYIEPTVIQQTNQQPNDQQPNNQQP